MTDRYSSLTVTFKEDIRDDDAEQIINAIKCLRGVLSVDGNISNIENHIAEQRVKREFQEKLWEILKT